MADAIPLKLQTSDSTLREFASTDTVPAENLPVIAVDGGGTGRATATAYAVLCGGTTGTGAHQSVAALGSAGQALLSAGAGALPAFGDVAPAAGPFVTIGNSAALSAERALTMDDTLLATDGGAGTTVTLGTKISGSRFHWQEHFIGRYAVGGSGGIGNGELGWLTTFGAGGNLTIPASTLAHPGQVRLSANGAAGVTRIQLASLLAESVEEVTWLLKPFLIPAAIGIRCGLSADPSLTLETAQGMYFSFSDASSANWRTVTRDGSGVDPQATSVVVDTTNWKKLTLKRSAASTWQFWINDVLINTHTSNISTSVLFPFAALECTSGAGAKAVDLDYFGMTSVALASQFS